MDVLGAPAPDGRITWSLLIPEDTGVIGMTIHQTGIVMDLPANPLGVIVTNSRVSVVGGF